MPLVQKQGGDHFYKLRHMNKAKLRKAGLLPKSVRCDPNLILDGRELLLNNGPNMADGLIWQVFDIFTLY